MHWFYFALGLVGSSALMLALFATAARVRAAIRNRREPKIRINR